MRQTHRWTDDERDIIRRDYQHTRASMLSLAKKLGVSPLAVRGQVQNMGICRSGDRQQWTAKQEEQLAELIPKYSMRKIARIMHRSINSVTVKTTRLHLSRRIRDGWFTKREVQRILGHDHQWLQRRIDCGALPATWHYATLPTQHGMSAWHIEEAALKEFIRRYPEELVGCNIDIMMIVEILVGVINGNK